MAEGPREKALKRLAAYRSRRLFEAVDGAVFEAADKVRRTAHRSISSGSVSGKGHVPSAPGEPPNRDTGVLQANMETESLPPKGGTFSARVTSRAPYAAALEFGTSKMAARPYLRPARDKVQPLARTLLVLKIKKALRVF